MCVCDVGRRAIEWDSRTPCPGEALSTKIPYSKTTGTEFATYLRRVLAGDPVKTAAAAGGGKNEVVLEQESETATSAAEFLRRLEDLLHNFPERDVQKKLNHWMHNMRSLGKPEEVCRPDKHVMYLLVCGNGTREDRMSGEGGQ